MSYERITPDFNKEIIGSIEDRIEQLKLITPEAFADGKINFDTLKEIFGENLEEEKGEHFGLFWPGKREARRLAVMPSKGTLVPCHGEGINEDNTNNIFIEGDNLEVLKILQKSYTGKIKMIYIDPPYNTGNDFIYDDNYSEPLEDYLQRTGQLDGEYRPLTTNTMADGRYHSKWLSMIYPRLRLARNLLQDDGVIFVSIDDNEVHNLRQIMNEIYGEENFIGEIVWKKRYQGAKEKYLVILHEYILFYSKNKEILPPIYIPSDLEYIKEYYKYEDELSKKRGPYRTQPLEAGKSMGNRENLKYSIKAPDGKLIKPKRQWVWGEDRVLKAISKNEIGFLKNKEGDWTVFIKQYLKDENGNVRETKAFSIIDDVFTQNGTKEIEEVFGNGNIFPFPKPTKLILKLFDMVFSSNADDIVLDFFSGSCSTSHAVINYNNKSNSNIKFICIQLPEPCPEDSVAYMEGYKNISEIGKERIRRVINNNLKELKNNENRAKNTLPGMEDSKIKYDLGFRVYKLTQSNFKPWSDYKGGDIDTLHKQLKIFESSIITGWKEKNLVTELMLMEGIQLNCSVNKLKQIDTNKIFKVSSDSITYSLHICTDEKISLKTIDALELQKEDRLICFDSALTDSLKMRLADICQLKTI